MEWPKDKLTRFESARLIGARSLQIALGAPVLVKTEMKKSSDVAKKEFFEKLIPITIKRKLPNGEHVVISMKKAIDVWIADHRDEI